MCGFIVSNIGSRIQIEKAGELINNRGPDATGYKFFNNFHHLHKRLSIIDLSSSANQPMFLSKGDLCITFNGEIYNYLEIKRELINQNYKFKTNSDTEVLLTLYSKYGMNFLNKIRGMFSFVIHDKSQNSLFLAKDHVGMKPLFYFKENENIIIASEIKPIVEILGTKKLNLNKKAISEYLKYGFINHTNTIYNSLQNFEHGHYAKLDLKKNKLIKKKWFINKRIENKSIRDFKGEIRKRIIESLKLHMISDRKFGLLLSGGLDSSILAYEISKLGVDIRAFTIKTIDHNEDYISAKKLANELNIPISKINVDIDKINIFDLIDNILNYISQPFSNPTPIYIDEITKEAAKLNYRVLLAGDGADEIFFGYPRHKAILYYQYITKFPFLFKIISQIGNTSKFLNLIKKNEYKYRFSLFLKSLPLNFEDAYDEWVSISNSDYAINKFIIKNYGLPKSPIRNFCYPSKTIKDKLNFAQYHDLNHFLPNNLLLGGDRASMQNSVELRFPYLDKEVINLKNYLPIYKNINLKEGKQLLKDAYKDKLPNYIIERRKKGFNPPTLEWINKNNHSIKNFLKEEMDPKFLKPILAYSKILLSESMLGNISSSNKLWTILVFLRWNQKFNIEKYL